MKTTAMQNGKRTRPPSARVRAALRERVKELTCLYRMAQISADPARSLAEMGTDSARLRASS